MNITSEASRIFDILRDFNYARTNLCLWSWISLSLQNKSKEEAIKTLVMIDEQGGKRNSHDWCRHIVWLLEHRCVWVDQVTCICSYFVNLMYELITCALRELSCIISITSMTLLLHSRKFEDASPERFLNTVFVIQFWKCPRKIIQIRGIFNKQI